MIQADCELEMADCAEELIGISKTQHPETVTQDQICKMMIEYRERLEMHAITHRELAEALEKIAELKDQINDRHHPQSYDSNRP